MALYALFRNYSSYEGTWETLVALYEVEDEAVGAAEYLTSVVEGYERRSANGDPHDAERIASLDEIQKYDPECAKVYGQEWFVRPFEVRPAGSAYS